FIVGDDDAHLPLSHGTARLTQAAVETLVCNLVHCIHWMTVGEAGLDRRTLLQLAAESLLVPLPSIAENRLQIRPARGPIELFLRACRIRNEPCWVAVSPSCMVDGNGPTRDPAGDLDDLAYGRPMPSAQIDGSRISAAQEMFECEHVSFG